MFTRPNRFWALRRCLPPALIGLLLVDVAVSCRERVRTVTIDNVAPRRDVNGQILDAHDGCLQLFNGQFYLYGTAYGTNNGYTPANRYRVYSSPDLEHWTLVGDLFRQQPVGVYYRPYVVFNSMTRKFVLWYNWYPDRWRGCAAVAVSDSPTGPFQIVSTNIQLSCKHPGDGSLFVDDDGTGYYIYTAIDKGYNIRIDRLTPDFLLSTGESCSLNTSGYESPVLFRRGNRYYALCGQRCTFCPGGSDIIVNTSTSPLGPYDRWPDYNKVENASDDVDITNNVSTVYGPSGKYEYTNSDMAIHFNAPKIHAQETWVAKIPTPDGRLLMWMADRWQSTPDGVKGHDFQFWAPMQFSWYDSTILPVQNSNQWSITVDLSRGK